MDESLDWFERVWAHREEVLYPALFGEEREGIFPIPRDRLAIGQLSDPRWSTCGVFRFTLTSSRKSWLYVSSGLSNAWFDESPDLTGVSGFGYEFVIETPSNGDWPIQRLHQLMVYQIGLCVGRYPGHDPLGVGHRVPLGSPIDFATSALSIALLVAPTGFDPELKQDTGVADFLQVVGISESERDFAKQHDHAALVAWLENHTPFPVTDPERAIMGPSA
jgi:hypothetical protein